MTMKMSTPLRDYLALRFVAVEPEGVRMRLELRDQHLNQAGTLHGGVVTTMIDIACAIAVRAYVDGTQPGPCEPEPEAGRPVVTLMLNTSFLETARRGMVTVTAQRRGGGARIHFATAQVTDDAGRLLASGDGSYTLRPRARHADLALPAA